MHNYTNVVTAALAETTSKFRLAEALAADIPARQSGPSDEANINEELEAARQAIIAAGGEPRSAKTLRNYRDTALWVRPVNGSNFQWVSGYSFTAHHEARMAGVSFEDFAANPRNARETRQEHGGGSKDGDPTKVVSGWSPEQKAAAAREVLSDPEVAREVYSDQEVATAAASQPTVREASKRTPSEPFAPEVHEEADASARNDTGTGSAVGFAVLAELARAKTAIREAMARSQGSDIPAEFTQDIDQWSYEVRDAIVDFIAYRETGDQDRFDAAITKLMEEEKS